MAGAGQGDQRIPQTSHRRGRVRGGHERTSDQDHRRTDKENQSDGGVKMRDEYISKVGVYGQMHYQYLKKTRPTTVNVMRMNGNLKSYLHEVDEQAEEMLFQLVKQMVKDEGVDEAMKRCNQMLWVQRMNNIRNRAEEIVLREVIFV